MKKTILVGCAWYASTLTMIATLYMVDEWTSWVMILLGMICASYVAHNLQVKPEKPKECKCKHSRKSLRYR